jgi:hypothetical protein
MSPCEDKSPAMNELKETETSNYYQKEIQKDMGSLETETETITMGSLETLTITSDLSYEDLTSPEKMMSHLQVSDDGRVSPSFHTQVDQLEPNELDQILDEYYSEKNSHEPISIARSSSGSSSIHDRLYKDGQVLAMRRVIAAQRKKESEKQVKPPKLHLATRTYTPRSERGDQKTHERLYNIGLTKKKQMIEDEAKMEAYNLKHTPKLPVPGGSKVGSRLYAKSKTYREEGKQKRETIAKKLTRDPTPTRSISVSRAQGLYDRGLSFVENRDKKIDAILNAPRESTFPKMRTQTPNRRERFFEARDSDSVTGRSQTPTARSRSRTPTARSSSVTPSRRDREPSQTRTRGRAASQTPSRNRNRSQTPTRRTSSQSNASFASPTKGGTTPKLPRSFKVNEVGN